MNNDTPQPVRSLCGSVLNWIGICILLIGTMVAAKVGTNRDYGAAAGWMVFGYCVGSAVGCFAISSALHLLARIATAVERTAEAANERQHQREVAVRPTAGCEITPEAVEQARKRAEEYARHAQTIASFTKP